jgi:hypothetical protein
MGYLNNNSVVVDCILTKKGREKLSLGRDNFNITQFALSDDEIDYSLWNPAHPLGSAYYGTIIENMPIVEAVPDETQMMKYKLVTLPRNTQKIPVISVGETSRTLNYNEFFEIEPQVINYTGGNDILGYTAILHNNDIATLSVATSANTNYTPSAPIYIGDGQYARSTYVIGKKFKITGKQLSVDKSTTITIIGNETGNRQTIQLTVKKYVQP